MVSFLVNFSIIFVEIFPQNIKIEENEADDVRLPTICSFAREGVNLLGLTLGAKSRVQVQVMEIFTIASIGRPVAVRINAQGPGIAAAGTLSCLDAW